MVDMVHSKIDGLSTKHNYVVDHGDIIDAIDPLDPRWYGGLTGKGSIMQQIERAKRNRLAIKDHLVCICDGNHPRKKWAFGAITKDVSDWLEVPGGGWWYAISYHNRRGELMYKHFCTHGRKTISSTADDPKRRRTNKQLILKRLLKMKSGSCVLMSRGHTHWLDRLPPEHDVYYTDNGKEAYHQMTEADHTAEYIHPDLRWYVSTGSFVKPSIVNNDPAEVAPITYSEAADLDPTLWVGFMLAKIRNGRIQEIEPVRVD